MGHHFDSPSSRDDGRIDICDVYVFPGEQRGTTTFVMTLSPFAGEASPAIFRPETAYQFKIDTDDDAVENLIYRLVFDELNDEGSQTFRVYRLEAAEAQDHSATGWEIAAGSTENSVRLDTGGRVWAGLAGDPFFQDVPVFQVFHKAIFRHGRYDPSILVSGLNNTMGAADVIGIVLEVSTAELGATRIGIWGTVAVDNHGRWQQVNRCGHPNLAATFNDDPERSEAYNAAEPSDDLSTFGPLARDYTARATKIAGTTSDPEGYGELVARRFFPDLIPYDTSLPASYGLAGINGRLLDDDAVSVFYSTLFNAPLEHGVSPPKDLRDSWPFLPLPRSRSVEAYLPSEDGSEIGRLLALRRSHEEFTESWPVVEKLQVRYQDLDPYGHVNNAAHMSYFESARVAYFRVLAERVGLGPLEAGDVSDIRYVIAEAMVSYRAPVYLQDTLFCGISVRSISNHSFTLDYELRVGENFEDGRTVADGSSVQVFLETGGGGVRPRPGWFLSAVAAVENKTEASLLPKQP